MSAKFPRAGGAGPFLARSLKLQTTPWHREEEPLNHHETPGRQIKQSNQLSLPHQDDCNTRMDIE